MAAVVSPVSLGGVNFNNFAGLQYFTVTVVPEPATMSLMGLAIAGLVGARRRK